MNTNDSKFIIIGKDEYISQVLNKLPNKKKLYDIYLYNSSEPLVEYGFSIYNNNNTYQFKIIICNVTSNITNDINNNEYFKNIDGLIICSDNNNNYDDFIKTINASENIYIWFTKDKIDTNDKALHYLFNDDNWINRIYNNIDMPSLQDVNNYCHII